MVRNKKRWRDLTTAQRVLIVTMGILEFALLATALIDIRRRPASAIKGGKGLWTALSFVTIVGPIAYFAFGRKR